MKLVASFEEVRDSISGIRNQRKGFLTNFFPEEQKVQSWITRQALSVVQDEYTSIFVKQDEGFANIFFCATTTTALCTSLSRLDVGQPCVLEVLSDKRTAPTLLPSLSETGFCKYKCLVRMSKVNDGNHIEHEDRTENVLPTDVPTVHRLLQEHFDKYAEQLPTTEELENLVASNHIIIERRGENVAGFVIYDLSPSTLHLRYWLVCPRYRGQGVGSHLFKEFCHRGESSRRHILWVMEDNDNARKRYEHYGYQTEEVKDYILMRNRNK